MKRSQAFHIFHHHYNDARTTKLKKRRKCFQDLCPSKYAIFQWFYGPWASKKPQRLTLGPDIWAVIYTFAEFHPSGWGSRDRSSCRCWDGSGANTYVKQKKTQRLRCQFTQIPSKRKIRKINTSTVIEVFMLFRLSV